MTAASRPSARLGHSLRRYFVDDFMLRRTAAIAPGSLVLDLGGHKQEKRGEFDIRRFPLRVVYANLTPAKRPDVQADAASIPFAAGVFDAVICAELMEHLPDPRLVLAETVRVLRRGGMILITVPFLYPIHADPYDFGRYTETYWRRALADHGFCAVEVEAQGTFLSVQVNQAKHAANALLPTDALGRGLRAAAGVGVGILQHSALWAEARLPADGPRTRFLRSYTTGYGLVGVKA